MDYEVALTDATETLIERPKKELKIRSLSKSAYWYLGKKKRPPQKHKLSWIRKQNKSYARSFKMVSIMILESLKNPKQRSLLI